MVMVRVGHGIPADNVGQVSGRVLRIEGIDDVLALLEDEDEPHVGRIALIADAGATFLSPIFPDLAGVICLGGSTGSHLAIVSRDFGTPAVFSVSFDGHEPVTGDIVTIDTGSGAVLGPSEEESAT